MADTVEWAFRVIQREGGEITIGRPFPLAQEQCDPEFVLMLPDTSAAIDAETMTQIEKVFDLGGEMEARPIH